jgi:serine/threonine-protein phosphatase 2A catalytic subunit
LRVWFACLQIAKLLRHVQLTESEVCELCRRSTEILREESNCVAVPAPCTVVGDIHGQLHDFIEIFKIGGGPPDTNFVFMGDFVDRGYHSVECISLVLSLKVWRLFTGVFDMLPLAATVGNQVLAVHGGLSPSIDTVDEIRALSRFAEIPEDGPVCDLLWSDPAETMGFSLSPRGAGFTFGGDVSAPRLLIGRPVAPSAQLQKQNDGLVGDGLTLVVVVARAWGGVLSA